MPDFERKKRIRYFIDPEPDEEEVPGLFTVNLVQAAGLAWSSNSISGVWNNEGGYLGTRGNSLWAVPINYTLDPTKTYELRAMWSSSGLDNFNPWETKSLRADLTEYNTWRLNRTPLYGVAQNQPLTERVWNIGPGLESWNANAADSEGFEPKFCLTCPPCLRIHALTIMAL